MVINKDGSLLDDNNNMTPGQFNKLSKEIRLSYVYQYADVLPGAGIITLKNMTIVYTANCQGQAVEAFATDSKKTLLSFN